MPLKYRVLNRERAAALQRRASYKMSPGFSP
jgi:hypothetical protein